MNTALLNKICEAIEREPKKFNMREWTSLDPLFDLSIPTDDQAPCCTAACIGGFAVMLVECDQPGDPDAWRRTMLDIDTRVNIGHRASILLGLTEAEAERLFFLKYWPDGFERDYRHADNPTAQAQVAIDRIKHFIATEGKE